MPDGTKNIITHPGSSPPDSGAYTGLKREMREAIANSPSAIQESQARQYGLDAAHALSKKAATLKQLNGSTPPSTVFPAIKWKYQANGSLASPVQMGPNNSTAVIRSINGGVLGNAQHVPEPSGFHVLSATLIACALLRRHRKGKSATIAGKTWLHQ